MATATKEAPKKEVAKANETQTTNAISLGGAVISREEAIKALQSMEKGEADSGYLEFEPGEEKRVVFLGWKEIPGLGAKANEKVNAASFLVENGKEQINADAVVVSYFEKQAPGVARLIQCTGQRTTGNGTYKTFKFYELNLKK